MAEKPFFVFGALSQFKETVEPGTLSHWLICKKLKFWTLNFASNEGFCKPKGHHNVKLHLFWVLGAFLHFGKTGFKSDRIAHAPYFHPLSLYFRFPAPREGIRVYSPLLKGAVVLGYSRWKPNKGGKEGGRFENVGFPGILKR